MGFHFLQSLPGLHQGVGLLCQLLLVPSPLGHQHLHLGLGLLVLLLPKLLPILPSLLGGLPSQALLLEGFLSIQKFKAQGFPIALKVGELGVEGLAIALQVGELALQRLAIALQTGELGVEPFGFWLRGFQGPIFFHQALLEGPNGFLADGGIALCPIVLAAEGRHLFLQLGDGLFPLPQNRFQFLPLGLCQWRLRSQWGPLRRLRGGGRGSRFRGFGWILATAAGHGTLNTRLGRQYIAGLGEGGHSFI